MRRARLIKPTKHRVILADPPWKHSRTKSLQDVKTVKEVIGQKRARGNLNYRTMTMEDLKDMRPMIDRISAPDSFLFMWAVSPMLQEAFDLMEAWGYSYKTFAFVWIKLKPGNDGLLITRPQPIIGTGSYSRANAEFVLLGRKGKARIAIKSKGISQIVFTYGKPKVHSKKPEEVQDRIERLMPGPYIELFARRERKNWTTWGDQV